MTETYLLLINTFGHLFILAIYLLAILFPKSKKTYAVYQSRLILVPILLIFAGLFVPDLIRDLISISKGASSPLPNIPTLDIVLFNMVKVVVETDKGAIGLWFDMLVGNLFICRWMYLDIYKKQYNALLTRFLVGMSILSSPLALGVYFVFDYFAQRASQASTTSKTLK